MGNNKPNKALTIEQREKALIEIDAMDEDADIAPNAILFTANEVQELPEVKKPDIVLGRDTKLEPIGTVTTIVDSVVVVQASSSGEVRVLDAGTVVVVMKPAEGDSDPIKEVLGEVSHHVVYNDSSAELRQRVEFILNASLFYARSLRLLDQ